MLSARARLSTKQPAVHIDDLCNIETYPFDVQVKFNAPSDLLKKVKPPMRALSEDLAKTLKPLAAATASLDAVRESRRVRRELKALLQDPHPEFSIFPCEEVCRGSEIFCILKTDLVIGRRIFIFGSC